MQAFEGAGGVDVISLPREMCVAAKSDELPAYGLQLLQEGLGKDAWRVAVASMLLCRTKRSQAEPCLKQLLARWPDAAHLARSDLTELEAALRPLGLQRNRARQLQRMSSLWHSDAWQDVRDLPGVGVYVSDAVGLFVFGCTDLESSDHALRIYAERL